MNDKTVKKLIIVACIVVIIGVPVLITIAVLQSSAFQTFITERNYKKEVEYMESSLIGFCRATAMYNGMAFYMGDDKIIKTSLLELTEIMDDDVERYDWSVPVDIREADNLFCARMVEIRNKSLYFEGTGWFYRQLPNGRKEPFKTESFLTQWDKNDQK